jgi:hypothetical protein
MTVYYLVQNGSVVEGPRAMKGSWRDTTNMECLSPTDLAALGWLPEVVDQPAITIKQKYGPPVLIVNAADVTKQYPVLQRTVDEVRDAINGSFFQLFDDKAAEKGWPSRLELTLRTGYAGPFRPDAVAFSQWVDSCIVTYRKIIADVKANLRPIPTWTEVLAELPTLTWP